MFEWVSCYSAFILQFFKLFIKKAVNGEELLNFSCFDKIVPPLVPSLLSLFINLARLHLLHKMCWVDSRLGSLTGQYDYRHIQYLLDWGALRGVLFEKKHTIFLAWIQLLCELGMLKTVNNDSKARRAGPKDKFSLISFSFYVLVVNKSFLVNVENQILDCEYINMIYSHVYCNWIWLNSEWSNKKKDGEENGGCGGDEKNKEEN